MARWNYMGSAGFVWKRDGTVWWRDGIVWQWLGLYGGEVEFCDGEMILYDNCRICMGTRWNSAMARWNFMTTARFVWGQGGTVWWGDEIVWQRLDLYGGEMNFMTAAGFLWGRDGIVWCWENLCHPESQVLLVSHNSFFVPGKNLVWFLIFNRLFNIQQCLIDISPSGRCQTCLVVCSLTGKVTMLVALQVFLLFSWLRLN